MARYGRQDLLKYGAAEYSVRYDNWEAMLAVASVPHSEDVSHSDSWCGGVSYKTALKLMGEGWSAGREQFVDGMADSAAAALAATHKRTVWTREVAGSRPAIGAYLAGQPRCMYRQRRDAKMRPIMQVMVNFVAGGGVATSTIENRGIALASWIDAAEATGTRVEVMLCYLAAPMEILITLKRAEDALDADRLAFALAHPAMLRHIGFGLIARDPKLQAHYSHSKGWQCNYTDLPAGVVYFPYLYDDRTKYATREMAVEYVNKQCNAARDKFAAEGALL